MKMQQLRQVNGTRPFRPFSLRLADGHLVRVEGPDALHDAGDAQTVAVAGSGGKTTLVDSQMVAAIEID